MGISRISDGLKVLGEKRQRPVLQVESLNVERPMRFGTANYPGDDPFCSASRSGTADNDFQLEHRVRSSLWPIGSRAATASACTSWSVSGCCSIRMPSRSGRPYTARRLSWPARRAASRRSSNGFAAGEGFSVVPQSVAMYYQRADITWMVLTDVAPNEVRLAWPTAQHGRLIEDYLEAARSTVTD